MLLKGEKKKKKEAHYSADTVNKHRKTFQFSDESSVLSKTSGGALELVMFQMHSSSHLTVLKSPVLGTRLFTLELFWIETMIHALAGDRDLHRSKILLSRV